MLSLPADVLCLAHCKRNISNIELICVLQLFRCALSKFKFTTRQKRILTRTLPFTDCASSNALQTIGAAAARSLSKLILIATHNVCSKLLQSKPNSISNIIDHNVAVHLDFERIRSTDLCSKSKPNQQPILADV